MFKINRNSKGANENYKTRLVVKGFSQIEEIDYNETFRDVNSHITGKLVMAF